MTTDYQQAAIEAAAKAMADDWNPDRDPILTAMFRDHADSALAAAEPNLRKKWAEEWGIGDETSRPLYDARQRIRELEGDVRYTNSEIQRLNRALDLLEGAGE